jgi:H2-forming N5,N10-methylenetetrahydromethanopterin dehydrogenase-like enzyme
MHERRTEMSILKNRIWAVLLSSLVALPALPAGGQSRRIHIRAFASNVVMPQSRSFSVDRRKRVEITGVKVAVDIIEQVATTRMDISLKNPTGSRMEAELLVPVPEGAVVKARCWSLWATT